MRSYPKYPGRETRQLDGIWDFCWMGDSVTLKEFRPELAVCTEKAAVPGVFDMGCDRFAARGLGVYRMRIDGFTARRARLHVAGMGLGARIFWDGHEVGNYPYAYSPMDFDFDSNGQSVHELIVAVDSRFDCVEPQIFQPEYDFYGFGGIYRSLTLYALPETFLDRAQVFTEDLTTGEVRIRVKIGGKTPDTLALELAFDDGAFAPMTATVCDGMAEFHVRVPSCKIWSPASPNLHCLHLRIDGDALTERFGLRTVSVRGQKILLNGEPVYLAGANRHESHPEFGPVQNEALILEDLRLFQKMGGNFLRCVHYPQDEAFLDLCDEMGVMVWEESLGWGLSSDKLFTPAMETAIHAENRLMVSASINHPSILIWAFLNECASNDAERAPAFYQSLADEIRAIDSTRLVSWASAQKMNDACFAAADVISINGYPGWFEDIEDSVTFAGDVMPPYFQRHVEYFNRPEFIEKPLFMSEIGACGMYGVHERNLAQWSEEFQSAYMVAACRNLIEQPRFTGFTLWQFLDSRSYARGQIRGKPRGYNLAGLIDEYRRPKLAYDAVQTFLHDFWKKRK